jgi:hypothetical protein
MSKKRNADEMGASGNKRPRLSTDDSEIGETKTSEVLIESKQKIFPIDDLEFFILNDNGENVPCAPKEANAIRTKDGTIYKQIGRDFKRAFASFACQFIRMYASFKCYTTPTARTNYEGRSIVSISDDDGKLMETQALKFACLAWGKLTPAAKLGTADMPLRDFGRAYPVDHGDGFKTNNYVSNGLIMTEEEHHAKTKQSAESIAKMAMSKSAPCTMTVFVSKGEPLLDSERNPIVKNYPHRLQAMIDYKLKSTQISNSINREDTTWNSLVKIKYEGQDCLAQFSWYDLPDLVDDDGRKEIWKPVTAADHKMLDVPMSKRTEYLVSDMSRFKFVTRSTQNARITNYRGKKRPSIVLMGKTPYFSRIAALVFHPEQLKAKIAELKIAKQKDKFGNDYTFATLQVDHIAENDPTNHNANNLQFMMPQKNCEKSNGRPCRIWEIGSDTKTDYPSVAAAARDIGYKDSSSVRRIIKNTDNPKNKWRGEYLEK